MGVPQILGVAPFRRACGASRCAEGGGALKSVLLLVQGIPSWGALESRPSMAYVQQQVLAGALAGDSALAWAAFSFRNFTCTFFCNGNCNKRTYN